MKDSLENKTAWILIAAAVLFCFAVFYQFHSSASSAESAESSDTALTSVKSQKKRQTEPAYAEKVFLNGTGVMTVNIIADTSEWQNMLENAEKEAYICADVIINGTRFSNVGIRPKGNSSLTQTAQIGSELFSFRLSFDKYIKGQSCFGLDTMVLNNMQGDNSYMKEYLSYEIMKTAGVECPYFAYSNISVNGEPWGLYLAIEMYDNSYLARVYGDTSAALYNVKMSGKGQPGGLGGERGAPPAGGEPPDGFPPQEDGVRTAESFGERGFPPEMPDPASLNETSVLDGASFSPPEDFAPSADADGFRGRHGGGMPGGEDNGGSLVYTDDSPDSYSSIFSNSVGTYSQADYARVISALKKLSDGEELDAYFDTDAVLRYLAAHTVSVNLDSYSSSMGQNYYVLERGGVVSILPWDYNLAWGGFQMHSAEDVVNFPIDTPVDSSLDMETRPLIARFLSNDSYRAQYHEYLQEIMEAYFADGAFAARVAELDALISPYVEADATAFCTFDAYKSAVLNLAQLGTLRAESISGQLAGTVPSEWEAQLANPQQLISADGVSFASLGSAGGGEADGKRDAIGRRGFERGAALQKGAVPLEPRSDFGNDAFDARKAAVPFSKDSARVSIESVLLCVLVLALIVSIFVISRQKRNY